jgi:hypothetical protein
VAAPAGCVLNSPLGALAQNEWKPDGIEGGSKNLAPPLRRANNRLDSAIGGCIYSGDKAAWPKNPELVATLRVSACVTTGWFDIASVSGTS